MKSRNKWNKEKLINLKTGFFKKFNQIYKALNRVQKKKRKKAKITDTKNTRKNITTHPKVIITECHKQHMLINVKTSMKWIHFWKYTNYWSSLMKKEITKVVWYLLSEFVAQNLPAK